VTSTLEGDRDYDPVTVTIFSKALENVAHEMAAVVVRSSGSPVIAEALDFAVGILDAAGEIISYGGYMVGYVGTARQCVRHLIEAVPPDEICPGDVFICNDPFTTGSAHTVDVNILRPVFSGDRLIAWCWSFAHLFDFGGVAAGGLAPMAKDAYAEGLRLPGVKIVSRGKVVGDIWRLIETNIRVPDLVLNDIRCLIASCNRGNDRVLDMVDHYGDDFKWFSQISNDLAEEAVRARIRQLPDGTYTAMEYVEHNGHREGLLLVHCSLTVLGDELIVDLSGSAPQSDGFVNTSAASAFGRAATPLLVSLACDLPVNEGTLRPLTFITKPGTICDARLPAPVSAGHLETGVRVCKAVSLILAKLQAQSDDAFVSGHVMAPWQDSLSGSVLYAPDEEGFLKPFFDMNGCGSGGGAQVHMDGMDVSGTTGQTMNSIPDIEINELDYPVLYLWRRLNESSGGLGTRRGGDGIEYAWTPWYSEGGQQSVFAACSQVPPHGLLGGYPGSGSGYHLVRGGTLEHLIGTGTVPTSLEDWGGDITSLSTKAFGLAVAPWDVVHTHVGGGGGLGDPLDRDPEAVASDLREGTISAQTAIRGYGVVMSAGQVDVEATRSMRDEVRQERRAWPSEFLFDDTSPSVGRDLPTNRSTASERLAELGEWCGKNEAVQLIEHADPETGRMVSVRLEIREQ
jgi:N-methylhydantoinase B